MKPNSLQCGLVLALFLLTATTRCSDAPCDNPVPGDEPVADTVLEEDGSLDMADTEDGHIFTDLTDTEPEDLTDVSDLVDIADTGNDTSVDLDVDDLETGITQMVLPEAPRLATCMTDGSEFDCASPPELNDWECAEGWIENTVGLAPYEIDICQVPERSECADGAEHFLGDASCAPVGTECPVAEETFLADGQIRALALGYDGPIVFVDPTSPAGGSGTREEPVQTIEEALGIVEFLGVVALAPGRYPSPFLVPTQIAIVGSCTESTLLEPDLGDADEPVVAIETPATLSNLSIGGLRPAVEISTVGVDPVVVGKVVIDGTLSGIQTTYGETVLSRVVIRDLSGPDGFGVSAELGTVVIDQALFSNANTVAVRLVGGTTTMSDVIVVDTAPESAEDESYGLDASDFAVVSLSRAFFMGNQNVGIRIGGTSLAELTDITVVGTVSAGTLTGCGIEVTEEAQATARRIRVQQNDGVGIVVGGDAHVSFEQVFSAENEATEFADDSTGVGVMVVGNGSFEGAEILVDQNDNVGVLAIEGGQAFLNDLVVTRTADVPGAYYGPSGLATHDDALVVVHRGYFADLAGTAIGNNPGGTMFLTDIVARDSTNSVVADRGITMITRGSLHGQSHVHTWPNVGALLRLDRVVIRGNTGNPFFGVMAFSSTTLELDEVVIERTNVGVLLSGGTPPQGPTVTLSDVLIRDLVSDPLNGVGGRGISVEDGGELHGTRVRIENTREVGFMARTWEASSNSISVELNEFFVSQVDFAECGTIPEGSEDSCIVGGVNRGGGMGIVVSGVVEMTVEGFVVDESIRVGLLIGEEGELDARRGEITRNAIGLNVINPEFDFEGSFDDVFIYDNDVDFARTDVHIPDPTVIPF